MVDETATDGEYLDLEIVEQELTRWLAMHDAARSIFDGLPPDQQEAIRRDGQASIVPLASLVSCRPELRELGATILQRMLCNTRLVRSSPEPMLVGPGGTLSHPSGMMVSKTGDEKTRNGATVEDEEVQTLRDEVAMLRRVILRHLDCCPQRPLEAAEAPGALGVPDGAAPPLGAGQ